MFTLKRQTELEFSYKPFQPDKAILSLTTEDAKLLCSNKSTNVWTTVGYYYVRFERWNTETSMPTKLLFLAMEDGLSSKAFHFISGTTTHLSTLATHEMVSLLWLGRL